MLHKINDTTFTYSVAQSSQTTQALILRAQLFGDAAAATAAALSVLPEDMLTWLKFTRTPIDASLTSNGTRSVTEIKFARRWHARLFELCWMGISPSRLRTMSLPFVMLCCGTRPRWGIRIEAPEERPIARIARLAPLYPQKRSTTPTQPTSGSGTGQATALTPTIIAATAPSID